MTYKNENGKDNSLIDPEFNRPRIDNTNQSLIPRELTMN